MAGFVSVLALSTPLSLDSCSGGSKVGLLVQFGNDMTDKNNHASQTNGDSLPVLRVNLGEL